MEPPTISSAIDLERALTDMGGARTDLVALIERLSPDDFSHGRAGGWSVSRVLHHLIESEAIYVKLMAHMTGRIADDVPVAVPSNSAEATAMLTATRAALHAAVDGTDGETLYRLTKFGHEEFSPLSLVENIASHERDHAAQIAALAPGADEKRIEPSMAWSPPRRSAGAARPPAIRAASAEDLPRMTEIYNHYVVNTAITFDMTPLSVEDRRPWFERYADRGRHRLLVAEVDGIVAGYTASSLFAAKQAYQTTVETTILCAAEAVGRGIGEALYTALFDALREEDVHLAVALITVPNRGSVGLHEQLGFTRAAVLREVGRKFDKYWDVAWYQKPLGR